MTKIIAHRGARSIAPENTIASAEIARVIGADLWETDVNLTADGNLIIFHDDHLLRTTNVLKIFPESSSFSVDTFNLSQIQMLDAGITFIETDPFGEIAAGKISQAELQSFEGEKIPTLEDVLEYTRQKRWPVNLELKDQTGRFKDFPFPQMVVNMIKKMRIEPELVIISSFNHMWLKDFQILFPEIEIQALVGDEPDKDLVWSDYYFSTYNVDSSRISMEDIHKLKMMGKKVNLFTVNNKDDMLKYIDAGVDGIFTDYPQIMKTLLNPKSK